MLACLYFARSLSGSSLHRLAFAMPSFADLRIYFFWKSGPPEVRRYVVCKRVLSRRTSGGSPRPYLIIIDIVSGAFSRVVCPRTKSSRALRPARYGDANGAALHAVEFGGDISPPAPHKLFVCGWLVRQQNIYAVFVRMGFVSPPARNQSTVFTAISSGSTPARPIRARLVFDIVSVRCTRLYIVRGLIS